jgi:hypothetical protein
MEKKSKSRISKWLLWVLLAILALLVILPFISPYKKSENDTFKKIAFTVEIEAPVSQVFAYLGNSDNASEWSVFVDHIISLNADEVKDGSVGSFRRCFKNADKTGIQWDEEIIEVVPDKGRKLTIFNMQHFPMKAENIITEQIYEPLPGNQCKLTFSLYFKEGKASALDDYKMHLASFQVAGIFKENMENIKRLNEN